MPSDSELHEPRTNAEQSETGGDFRVSYESRDDLYFIQIEPGPVKIGRTANVKERISHIQCASPYDVALLATIAGESWSGPWRTEEAANYAKVGNYAEAHALDRAALHQDSEEE